MGGVILLAVACLLQACAPALVRNAVPAALSATARPAGFEDVRYWGDEVPANLEAIVAAKLQQVIATRPWLVNNPNNPLAFLALSGGGSDGAYGAGLLTGWTAGGHRPEFEIVTGVSTGALIAPFAFLGPRYDGYLTDLYTNYSTKELVTTNVLGGLLGGSGLVEDSKLQELIAHYITAELVAEVAAEHAKGRRLLIGTTNLDAQRPVIWDMGAIASRRSAEAVALFRSVMLASASIPAVFPPVIIQVEANGKSADEMHVDGGTTSEVFFLPPALLRAGLSNRKKSASLRQLYVVINNKLNPDYEAVKPATVAIAKRSISTLIKSQGLGDLFRLRATAQSAGVTMRVAAIPADFQEKSHEAFDLAYMKVLFSLGYSKGFAGEAFVAASDAGP